MLSNMRKWMSILVAAGLILAAGAMADDLDDGIAKQTDDPVSADDQLGSKDRNITFIKMNAKSSAKVKAKDGQLQSTQGANMNSVVMGPGSNIKGDVIIIDESKGPKTIIAD